MYTQLAKCPHFTWVPQPRFELGSNSSSLQINPVTFTQAGLFYCIWHHNSLNKFTLHATTMAPTAMIEFPLGNFIRKVAGDYFSQEVYHIMQTRRKNCVPFWCSDYSMTALIHLDKEKPSLALNPHWYLFTAISSHLKYKFNIAGSWSWVKTPVASRVEIWSLIWVGSRSNSGYCAHVNAKA